MEPQTPSEPYVRLAAKQGDRRWNEASERLHLANEYAQGGLKGLFLANGGAIVALLTFIGNAKVNGPNAGELWSSFMWFSIGLASVLAAYIAGYVSHAFYMQAAFNLSAQGDSEAHQTGESFDFSSPERKGGHAEWIGIGLVIFSLISFLLGAFRTLSAMT